MNLSIFNSRYLTKLRIISKTKWYSTSSSEPTTTIEDDPVHLKILQFKARALYKELHYLGKNYPDPSYPFHKKLHNCFLAHVGGNVEKVENGIRKAEFIKKEIEALYFLKKYRAMKGRYYPDDPAHRSWDP